MTIKINTKTRKIINGLNSKYHNAIPLDDAINAAMVSGLQVIDEDGEDWEGFVCGKEGHTTFNMKDVATNKIVNNMLVLSWYKMPVSGKYEVNFYFS